MPALKTQRVHKTIAPYTKKRVTRSQTEAGTKLAASKQKKEREERAKARNLRRKNAL